ncbi:MAG: flagellar hook-length control protein FliK [Gemmatimonas sp.]
MPPLTEEQCLLILNGLPHIGPVTLHRLLAALGGDPGRVLTAPREELLQVQGGAASLAPGEAAAQRVAAQLAVLQHQGLALQGPAWPGQTLRLTIEREPAPRDAPVGAPPVFTAHLQLDLPQLGRVEVRLRLAGDAIATTLGGAGAAGLVEELPALIEALRARGLTPVATQVLSAG